jgi:hypothetical protein
MELKRATKGINLDKDVQSHTKLGFCREWTKAVILFVRKKFPTIKAEAREVDISPGLQHTFARLIEEGEEPIICDGVGTVNHPPYFGLESEAPAHLQNSKSDMINKYL